MENNASVTDRAIGPLADMYVALKNPFGIGLSNLTATVEDVAREIFKTPIFTRTSTITFYFAAFGWISGIVVVLSLLNFTKKIAHSLLLRLVMFAGIIFMSISTPMNDSAIFITLLFLGLHENISENNTELITIT